MRAPTKKEADTLARAHERAAAVLRSFATGKLSEDEASKAYVNITTAVQAELTATEEWRRRKA